jgi:hypothetical protein
VGSVVVGFSGSRSCLRASALCGSVVRRLPASVPVVVGCAAGVDARVRFLRPSAVVFRAAGSGAAALVARSVSLVRALAGVPSAVLFVFPSAPCPLGVRPSPAWAGRGSGSWGSAALAVGLGVPVVVFAFCPPWAGLGFCVRPVVVFGVPGWLIRSPATPSLFQTQGA